MSKILELLERNKLRIPPTVYYDLKADVVELLEDIESEVKHHSEHFINDDGDDCLAVYEDDVLEIINGHKAEDIPTITIPVEDYLKLLEGKQEPILDKIRAEIAEPTNASSNRDYDEGWEDAVKRDLRILDKYKADRSEEETETWHGYHGDITAPKGTFDKIFNDAEEDFDDI